MILPALPLWLLPPSKHVLRYLKRFFFFKSLPVPIHFYIIQEDSSHSYSHSKIHILTYQCNPCISFANVFNELKHVLVKEGNVCPNIFVCQSLSTFFTASSKTCCVLPPYDICIDLRVACRDSDKRIVDVTPL